MAWSVSTSVCLPLLLVLCAVGTSVGITLSDFCSKDNMTTVKNFNANAFQGDWYLSHITMDLGISAYKSNIKKTVPLTTPKVRNFLHMTGTAVFKSTKTCKKGVALTELRSATYTSMEWSQNFWGSYYIYQNEYNILATDYTTTMVLLTESIIQGARQSSMNHVDIFVRTPGAEPSSTVVTAALDTFCGGTLNDVSSASFTKISYTELPTCF